jgi:hypothetical protein
LPVPVCRALSGGKIGIGISDGRPAALPNTDFSKLSNERLAQLEAMFLQLEAEVSGGGPNDRTAGSGCSKKA